MVDVTTRFDLTELELGKRYSREDLGIGWSQTGIQNNENYIILFVTLEGIDYEDYFVSKGFYWHSQNKQDINSKIIKEIQNKEKKVILFIRKESKIKNKTQKYLYAGELEYITYNKNTKNPVLIKFESLNYGIDELSEIYSWEPKNRIEEEIGSNTKVVLTKTTGLNNITQEQIDCLTQKTSLPEEDIKDILYELENKKQIILQGPPGTGKTYVAKKIAECLKLKKGMVQFHESYSYEEFLEGYKPSSEGGELKFDVENGRFKEFVKELSNLNYRYVKVDGLEYGANFDDIDPKKDSFVFKEISVGDFVLVGDDKDVRRFGVVGKRCESEGGKLEYDIDWCVFPNPLPNIGSEEFSLDSGQFFEKLSSLELPDINFFMNTYDTEMWEKIVKNNFIGINTIKTKTKGTVSNLKKGDVVFVRRGSDRGRVENYGVTHLMKFVKKEFDVNKIKNDLNIKPKWTYGTGTEQVDGLLYLEDPVKFKSVIGDGPFPSGYTDLIRWKYEDGDFNYRHSMHYNNEIIKFSDISYFDYFMLIIRNFEVWNDLSTSNKFDILQYLVTVYNRLENDVKEVLNISCSRGIFIIDEINRGRTSSILGELLYLLEYRGEKEKITLPYSGEKFGIPDNLWIVGTMNTADRNIVGMAEYALRRRFAFFTLKPNPDLLDNFIKNKTIREKAKAFLNEINAAIKDQEEYLGEGYAIGHSYFMKRGLDVEGFRRVIEYHVGPLVEEYCKVVDNADKMKEILDKYK